MLALVDVLTSNESELFGLAGPGCAGSIDAAATLSVTRHGAITGIPSRAEVATRVA